MADEHITWDKPEATDDSHITWDKPAPEASVWEAMKKGFGQAMTSENLQDIARQAGPTASARMAAPIKLATGMAKLPANILNLAGVSQPLTAVNQGNKLAEDIATAGGGDKSMLPGAMNLGGEFATGMGGLNVLGKAAPIIEKAAPYVKPAFDIVRNSPITQSILGGAALGAAGSESQSPMDIAKEAVLGGTLGGATHGVLTAAGHAMDPVLKRVAELRAKGISMDDIKNTSIGQMLGGITQKAENFLENIPFSGAKSVVDTGKKVLTNLEKANAAATDTSMEAANRGLKYANQDVVAQQKAAQAAEHAALDAKLAAHHENLAAAQKDTESAFHKPMIERAVEPLGIKPEDIPEDLSGTALMKWAQDTISNGYEKVLPTIRGIRITGAKEKELNELTEKYTPNFLGNEYSQAFENDIQRLIDTTNKGGWINSTKWQGELSDLSNEASRLLNKPDATTFERRYGMALRDLKDNWMDLIEGKNGSEAFKNLNTAFSRLQAPQKAASYVKSIVEGGEFNPQQLLQAIKSGMSTKRFAGGEDELQQLATQGHADIMAGRAKLKADKLANEKALADAKAKEVADLEAKHTQAERNLGAQQRQNTTAGEQQKSSFKETIDKAKDIEDSQSGAAKRIGYGLTGLGGTGYLAHMAGVSPLTTLGAGAALLGGSNLLYSNLGQKIVKDLALAERPEAIKQIGKALKKNAPLGALSAVQSYQQARQNPLYSGDNVTIEGAPDEGQK
jgi:hypothetical protein